MPCKATDRTDQKGHSILCPPEMRFPLEHRQYDPHLQITHICSLWRNVAFDTSTLWSMSFYRLYLRESAIELAKALFGQVSDSKLSLMIYRTIPTYVPENLKIVWKKHTAGRRNQRANHPQFTTFGDIDFVSGEIGVGNNRLSRFRKPRLAEIGHRLA